MDVIIAFKKNKIYAQKRGRFHIVLNLIKSGAKKETSLEVKLFYLPSKE